jgi:lipopolysaccharide export system permease protein
MPIIFRYLTKETLSALLAITTILLAIFLCNQLVRYLGYAADGRLSTEAVLQLVAVSLPYLLGLLLPLSLYLSILFTYGRLYADNEITVLSACGVSQVQLIRYILPLALIISACSAVLTLWVIPQIANYRNQLLETPDSAARLQTIFPGRFQEINGGKQVVYVENLSHNRQRMRGVFMAEQSKKNYDASYNDGPLDPQNIQTRVHWDILSATSGYQRVDKKSNELFIITNDGYRYIGTPGQNDYQILQYKVYGVKIQSRLAGITADDDALPTYVLIATYNLHKRYAAELQWRISLPLMAIVLVFLAVPLSRLRRGQGRYAKMLPGILICILYANMLFIGRNWITDGTVSTALGLWWVHAAALLLAGILLLSQSRYGRQWEATLFSRLYRKKRA